MPTSTRFTLSVGATPTTTSAQNLLSTSPASPQDRDAISDAQTLITRIQKRHDLELHAGVYTTNDLQQLATHATPHPIGLRILAEVLSTYPTGRSSPEALIGAGSLALGREPCAAYPGWGVVAGDPWGAEGGDTVYDVDMEEGGREGWYVGRVSQEHGVLVWEGRGGVTRGLRVGQKVLVWPNHACIAGAHFGWYLVVDSGAGEVDGGGRKGTEVVDVWVRCRGW